MSRRHPSHHAREPFQAHRTTAVETVRAPSTIVSDRLYAEVIMRKVRTSRATAAGTMHSQRTTFNAAVKLAAARVGVKKVNVVGTPASVFRTRYAAVLRRIKAGSIEVITHQGEPFIVLGMKQLLALVADKNVGPTASELLAGLPSVPASPSIPRYQSVLNPSHHRVPRSNA